MKTKHTHGPGNIVLAAWQEQIAQAKEKPWLASLLLRQGERVLRRFIHFYEQLRALSRNSRRLVQKRLTTTLAGAALLLALSGTPSVNAATITVDGVNCTLAEAITSANNDNAAGNGCVDGSGTDTINLQTAVTLSGALPEISASIILEGNGYTINGNNAVYHVLDVRGSGDLTLNNATITGGNANGGVFTTNNGGGIFNRFGTVTLNNTTVSGNAASNDGGGIYSLGGTAALTLNNSVVSGNSAGNDGGGILNSGSAVVMTLNNSEVSGNSSTNEGGGIQNTDGATTLNNSTVSGNAATINGGGIYNTYGTVTLTNSAISGNTANNVVGGGILNYGGTLTLNNSIVSNNSAYFYGGGIINTYHATATLTNSTVSGNSATNGFGGGIFNRYFSTLTLNNSTISGNSASTNGGGIYNRFSGTVITLSRSLITGNTAASGAEIYNFGGSGTIYANDYNLLGDSGHTNAQAFSNVTLGASDITATSDGSVPTAIDSILDSNLVDNGGPTLSHALVSGSPAIDAAPSYFCGTDPIYGIDQRGAARNMDLDGSATANECDIGAIEFRESFTIGSCAGAPLSGAQNFNFTQSSNTVTVNVNTANGLACLTVEEMGPGVNHLLAAGPGGTGQGTKTNNWWHISGNVNSGLDVDITMPFTSADTNSRLCKWPGGLGNYGWDCGPQDGTGTTFVANTSVTRSGLSSFSDWAVGDAVGPTAVSLQNVSATSGTGQVASVLSMLFLTLGALWLRIRRRKA